MIVIKTVIFMNGKIKCQSLMMKSITLELK